MRVVCRYEVFRHGVLYWHSGVEHQKLLASAKSAILHLKDGLDPKGSIVSAEALISCLKKTKGYFGGKAAELLVDMFVTVTGRVASDGVSTARQLGNSAGIFLDAFMLFLYFQAYTCDFIPGKSPGSFARSEDHWPAGTAPRSGEEEGSTPSRKQGNGLALSLGTSQQSEHLRASKNVVRFAPGAALGATMPHAEGTHDPGDVWPSRKLSNRVRRDLAVVTTVASQHHAGHSSQTPSPRKTALEARAPECVILAAFFREHLEDMTEIVFGSSTKGNFDTITLAQIDTLGLYVNALAGREDDSIDGYTRTAMRFRDLSCALPPDWILTRSDSVKSIRKKHFFPWLLEALAREEHYNCGGCCDFAKAVGSSDGYANDYDNDFALDSRLAPSLPSSLLTAGIVEKEGGVGSEAETIPLCRCYGGLRLSNLRGKTVFRTDTTIPSGVAINSMALGENGKAQVGTRSPSECRKETSNMHTHQTDADCTSGPWAKDGLYKARGDGSKHESTVYSSILMSLHVSLCEDSSLYALSASRFAYIAGCTDSTIVLGAVGNVLSIENCERTTIVSVSSRLRICNCVDCVFFTSTTRAPVLSGDNRGLKFAPFNTSFPGLRSQIVAFPELASIVLPGHIEWFPQNPLSLTASGDIVHQGKKSSQGNLFDSACSGHERDSFETSTLPNQTTRALAKGSPPTLQRGAVDMTEISEQKKAAKRTGIARFSIMNPEHFSLCSVPVKRVGSRAQHLKTVQEETFPVVPMPREYLMSLASQARRASALRDVIGSALDEKHAPSHKVVHAIGGHFWVSAHLIGWSIERGSCC